MRPVPGRLVVVLPPALFLALLAGASPAFAAAPESPHITDPLGDAGPHGVAAPSGFEAWDLVAAWFHDESPEAVTLTIEVAAAEGPPPSGEVGVTFEAGSRFFIAGYTVVPPVYSGGFLCT